MEASTITTRTLEIDGMCCDACVQKITAALRNVHGVSTQSVKVGSVTIGADQAGCAAACTAIEGAGFKARERACSAQTNGQTYANAVAGNSACCNHAPKSACSEASTIPLAASV